MTNQKSNIKNSTLVNKAIYFVIFAFLFIFPAFSQVSSFSGSTDNQSYELGNYSISAFHVDIDVDEQNVLEIQETITIQPQESMRGIIRAIPIYQKVAFEENGKEYALNYKTEISNIQANETSYIYEENGFVLIRLGSENLWFNSSKTYTINYTLNLGDDRISEFDQFYFNVIGTDWDAPISNISFKITMPKALSAGKEMFVYSGEYGSANEESFAVDSNLITFEYLYSGSLNAYEGLSVRLRLEKGYFDFSINQTIAWTLSVIALAVLIVLLLWFVNKLLKTKKQIVTPVLMFSSPDDLPPSELGYIIDGVVDNQDITSLIIYWAEKGFLKISEDKKKYTLIKLKDMEESGYQKVMFNKIFETAEAVKLEDIGENIYMQVYTAKSQIKAKYEKTQFDIKNKNSKNLFAFLAVAIVTAVTTTLLRVSVEPYYQLGVAILGIISLGLAHLFMHQEKIRFKKSLDQHKDKTMLYMLPILAIWILMAVLSFNFYFDKLLLSFLVLIPATIIMLLAFKLAIRKDEGLELFGQVLGFKQFISYTEKDRIKMLAKEDPQMFYSVLPYAYVLGVSDEWINKFEGVALNAPSWYESTSHFGIFDYLIMRSIFNSIMLSSITQMSYTPANLNSHNTRGKGGGGFGGLGGGFTGGGFGGGGGRGW